MSNCYLENVTKVKKKTVKKYQWKKMINEYINRKIRKKGEKIVKLLQNVKKGGKNTSNSKKKKKKKIKSQKKKKKWKIT